MSCCLSTQNCVMLIPVNFFQLQKLGVPHQTTILDSNDLQRANH
jgi:hypothetical protein